MCKPMNKIDLKYFIYLFKHLFIHSFIHGLLMTQPIGQTTEH